MSAAKKPAANSIPKKSGAVGDKKVIAENAFRDLVDRQAAFRTVFLRDELSKLNHRKAGIKDAVHFFRQFWGVVDAIEKSKRIADDSLRGLKLKAVPVSLGESHEASYCELVLLIAEKAHLAASMFALRFFDEVRLTAAMNGDVQFAMLPFSSDTEFGPADWTSFHSELRDLYRDFDAERLCAAVAGEIRNSVRGGATSTTPCKPTQQQIDRVRRAIAKVGKSATPKMVMSRMKIDHPEGEGMKEQPFRACLKLLTERGEFTGNERIRKAR